MTPEPGIIFIEQVGLPMTDAYTFKGSQFWNYICTLGVAQAILAKVQACPGVQNVQMQLEAEPFAMITIVPGIGMYTITGVDASGLPFDEYAGDLATREAAPNPSVDGTGGPNIHFRDIPSIGWATAYWGP